MCSKVIDTLRWESKRLGELGSIVRGGSPRPAGDTRYFGGDFIPLLTVAALTNIPDHQLLVTETQSGLTEAGSKRSRTLVDGNVIIVAANPNLSCFSRSEDAFSSCSVFFQR